MNFVVSGFPNNMGKKYIHFLTKITPISPWKIQATVVFFQDKLFCHYPAIHVPSRLSTPKKLDCFPPYCLLQHFRAP